MRFLPHTDLERQDMLTRIGVEHVDALFADVPGSALLKSPVDLPTGQTELAVMRRLIQMASRNVSAGSLPFFLGCGAYRHHIPASVDHLIQRSEFLTSYTPYQPEVSQGTLQVLFEFQTQVAALTGMEVANASMYDGSTAASEAVLMAHRLTKRESAILSGALHPQYADVIRTVSRMAGHEVVSLPVDLTGAEDVVSQINRNTSCVVVQSPDFFGNPRDLRMIAEACHINGALLIAVVCEVVSLGLLASPGTMGADIVVCEGQSLGNSLNFGGPYLGLMATRQDYVRQMPGRLCGQTVDAEGRRSFVLTLSTREQHIRREKATSNICTNSGLCALAFSIHLSLLGGIGLQKLARVNHANAVQLAKRIDDISGAEVLNTGFFNEFTVRVHRNAAEVIEGLAKAGVLGGVPVARLMPDAGMDDLIIVASTETNTEDDRDKYTRALRKILN